MFLVETRNGKETMTACIPSKLQQPGVAAIKTGKFKPIETRPLRTQLTRKNNDCVYVYVTSTGFITLRALSKIISSDQ